MTPSDIATNAYQTKTSRFSDTQLALVDYGRIPSHIAIIPDGNRRWARRHLSSTLEGHQEGADTLMQTVKAASDLTIKMVTFYAFSTENWKRPSQEIMPLFDLMNFYLLRYRQEMVVNGVKFETIGVLDRFPSSFIQTIQETKKMTQCCDRICLVLALNYGARDELCRAFKAMLEDFERRQLKKEEINEELIAQYLDTSTWEDPDLLIRTSGENRISNFLLWQLSYTELYTSSVLWPDFQPEHLLEAVLDYQRRERRWGKS